MTFDPMIPPTLDLDAVYLKLVRDHQIAIEALTERQVAEVIKQAVHSGDFTVNVVANQPLGTHRQGVVYLPGQGVDELRSEVQTLKERVKELEAQLERALPKSGTGD